jgi:hypothetical protein
MKAFVRGKLIALSASKKKLERAHTSSFTTYLKALEKRKQIHPRGVFPFLRFKHISHLLFTVLKTGPRVICIPGKFSTTELPLQLPCG